MLGFFIKEIFRVLVCLPSPYFFSPLFFHPLPAGVLIIIFPPIFLHFHFRQNPKKPSCLLRILLKLVPDAKYRFVASSPKALTTLGS